MIRRQRNVRYPTPILTTDGKYPSRVIVDMMYCLVGIV